MYGNLNHIYVSVLADSWHLSKSNRESLLDAARNYRKIFIVFSPEISNYSVLYVEGLRYKSSFRGFYVRERIGSERKIINCKEIKSERGTHKLKLKETLSFLFKVILLFYLYFQSMVIFHRTVFVGIALWCPVIIGRSVLCASYNSL